MKKVATCLFLMTLCASGGFAAAVTPSRSLPTSNNNTNTSGTSDATVARTAVAARTPIKRDATETGATTTATADAPVATPIAATATTTVTPSRTATVSRTVATTATDITPTSRGSGNTRTTTGYSRSVAPANATSARDNLDAAVSTVGRNARVSAASINNTAAVRRAGVTLRPSTAEVGGRATIGNTGVQTGSNVASEVRAVQTRAAVTTRETIADAKERLEQTAELNKSCQEQYNDCMDQFCAVIDSNQKRCSCSSNLSRYTKVESAVKDANTQLNEVAQRIRYIGLSADEIRAIMSATEAEEALAGQRDTTESRNMLQQIEDMIKDPTSSTSYYSGDSFSGLDLDLDFSSDSSDLFNLDFLNNNSSSLSNMRGADLYNAAKKRCNTILKQCKDVGATSQQITANYDLAIDKDCLAYEQGLSKMNDTLKSNVRSANLMLQKARLAVLQNKNQYDAKGCIAALDTCMTDDMVCGENYVKCLDPTKKYIDENGNVVLGQNITHITKFMDPTNYSNANIDAAYLANASTQSLTTSACIATPVENKKGTNNDGACIARYLLDKIGTGKKVSDNGLCRAVLDKCQQYTYKNDTYQPYNDVVVSYIQRAMVNVQAAQRKIISDYASTCMTEIATCYNQQVTQVNAWSNVASVDSIYRVMTGACHNVALTCAYAVFANDTQSCPKNDDGTYDDADCIKNISEMFYQSLLCPDNSDYAAEQGTADSNGYVNDHCKCRSGYYSYNNQCYATCPVGTEIEGTACKKKAT
ncbi:MAG: hypothetical protein K2L94_00625 [Alphaproteobacteria bacterium]|nr:hypothetical protein [Alphaproteobacteria bacterium]